MYFVSFTANIEMASVLFFNTFPLLFKDSSNHLTFFFFAKKSDRVISVLMLFCL